MTTFRNILYVSEPRQDQRQQLAKARALSRAHQARLSVVEVIAPASRRHLPDSGLPGPETLFGARKRVSQRRLDDLLATVEGGDEMSAEVVTGTGFLSVIEKVNRDKIDLVIKPAANPDWLNRLFGSDDMHLLRKCPCPVWMMKPGASNELKTVAACIDVDPEAPPEAIDELNDRIINLAIELALADGASLHVVHAWESAEAGFASLWASDPEAAERTMLRAEAQLHQRCIDRLAERVRARIGEETYRYLKPQWHVVNGPPQRVIARQVASIGADLAVMGTVARTGIAGLIIGNTAESILEQLDCSVVAVKPPGFVSPVR